MEFQWSYFKSWKMMLWKCCTQYASKFGKVSSGHRTGKDQFSFQSQRRTIWKIVHTTVQFPSFHILASLCSKSFKPVFSSTWTENFHELRTSKSTSWALKRQRNQRSNCQHALDHRKCKRVPGKHLLLLYWVCQSLWLCASQQTLENSWRYGNTRPPYLSPEKPVCRSRSNS